MFLITMNSELCDCEIDLCGRFWNRFHPSSKCWYFFCLSCLSSPCWVRIFMLLFLHICLFLYLYADRYLGRAVAQWLRWLFFCAVSPVHVITANNVAIDQCSDEMFTNPADLSHD